MFKSLYYDRAVHEAVAEVVFGAVLGAVVDVIKVT